MKAGSAFHTQAQGRRGSEKINRGRVGSQRTMACCRERGGGGGPARDDGTGNDALPSCAAPGERQGMPSWHVMDFAVLCISVSARSAVIWDVAVAPVWH